jgi:hypothetical protein
MKGERRRLRVKFRANGAKWRCKLRTNGDDGAPIIGRRVRVKFEPIEPMEGKMEANGDDGGPIETNESQIGSMEPMEGQIRSMESQLS